MATINQPVTMNDWQGRKYEIEIARVPFLGGYVAWIDDEPYLDGETFLSHQAALSELRHHLGG